ncbi:hypothetical protein SAMN04489832_0380 [Micromonospora cremea]|uniref:Uncharacterized protein n=1 Tax=Micromonospora cremea TaxID=709881 RepID=A0A1N5TV95_9ACTN|nr:hypothetical protein SAMN04489832_0380 [Micromonospora cremea]
MEAMRALKRRLSNVVYARIVTTRNADRRRIREGTRGRFCNPA